MKTIKKSIFLGTAAFCTGQLMCSAFQFGGPAAMDANNWTTNSMPYVQGTTDGFSMNWENVLANTASANIGNNNFELTFEANTNYTIGHLFLYNEALDLATVPGGIQQMTWSVDFEATGMANWIPVIAVTDAGVTTFYRSNNTGNSWNGSGPLNFTAGAADNAFWVGLSGDPVGGINESRVAGVNPNLQAASGMVQFGFIQWGASTGGSVSPALDFTTAIDEFVLTINEVELVTAVRDSAAFEATYTGNEIFDGANFINDWAEPGAGGTDVEPELNGEILTLVNNANNGWVELDNGATGWENGVAGGGSWTAEVRIKLANDAGNGFVIWAANGTERGILQVDTNAVSPFGLSSIDDNDNTDDFHTFRMAYDSDIGLYFFWRDGVLLTPGGGVAAQAGTGNNRLIIGDCCSSYLMTSVEVEYVRFDTTGAFGPDLSQTSLALDVTHDAATGELSISWESEAGRLYNLRSESDPASAQPIDWPIVDGQEKIAATPPLNTVTFPLPAESLRLFVVEDFPAPPVSIFSDDFESGLGLWTTGSTGADGTAWELGAPGVPGPLAANSPTNCFGTNLTASYGVDADVWLRSPPIDLTTASGATLNYFQSLDIETQFDVGSVRVFDTADDSELAVVTAVVDGSVPDWTMVTKRLPEVALGKTVVIEFRFQSDELENFAGWYIDDFKVTVP
jgi:hypothetical protein